MNFTLDINDRVILPELQNTKKLRIDIVTANKILSETVLPELLNEMQEEKVTMSISKNQQPNLQYGSNYLRKTLQNTEAGQQQKGGAICQLGNVELK